MIILSEDFPIKKIKRNMIYLTSFSFFMKFIFIHLKNFNILFCICKIYNLPNQHNHERKENMYT